VALYSVQAHCGARLPEGGLATPAMPDLLSETGPSDDSGLLPDHQSVPVPQELEGLDLSAGVSKAVDGASP
jgi:hypothetical protein